MVINFSDGISVDTTGELRVIRLSDGLYVAGRGFLIPVKDGEEAEATIREMSKNKGDNKHEGKETDKRQTPGKEAGETHNSA